MLRPDKKARSAAGDFGSPPFSFVCSKCRSPVMPDQNSVETMPMVQFVAVSQERHASKKWQRHANYRFAATEALAPIVGAELSKAALSMPLAFSEQAGRYTLVAVLSLTPGRNMFVGSDGRWLGSYIPACFRSYPFNLLPQPGTDQLVLCVDEDSGLVVDANAAGENFFDQAGAISPALKAAFEFLTLLHRSRQATDLAVSALAQAGVIKPWQIKLKSEQGEQAISGLHHVDEAALGALPDEAFLKLRTALSIAYAQMLSMGQLEVFAQLAKLHSQPGPAPVAALPESLDSLLERLGDDTIRFK
jgi:hypothetical protein